MDFTELECIEGLRWSWNSWPTKKSEAKSLIIPLSIICTPLMQTTDLPILPYDPLICSSCGAVLNPYARVDYQSRIWCCPFCYLKNPFPRSYIGIGESNLPAELFPTYSAVEYAKRHNPSGELVTMMGSLFSSSSSSSSVSLSSMDGVSSASPFKAPAFVFVVDGCMDDGELRAVKNELLLVVEQLPENALVGLVTFDSMVRVHDLGFSECTRVVMFHGQRELSSEQTQKFLGISRTRLQQLGKTPVIQKQSFLLPISECEFNITTSIEEIHSTGQAVPGHRPLRSTGAAISAALGLLEGNLVNTGSRIMVFTSGPGTLGPGIIVDSDLSYSIRTHRDLINGHATYYRKSFSFYECISQRLTDASVVLDLFACSLDQVGAAELKVPVEKSGGFLLLGESFDSNQFRKCLRQIFSRDEEGNINMYFDATIEVVTTKDVEICGALGPCVSLRKMNSLVSDNEIGDGGTYIWKLGTLTNKTCIAFFFQVGDEQKAQPGSAFFVQFITHYRNGNMGIRKRVATVARRWVGKQSPEITAGFDQEAAASVMARLAIHRAETCPARDVIRWLDDTLIRFASKFGDYLEEDPSSFRLSSNFSLYPQFMFYLRRSQFIDVFNCSPDETAFFQLMLNREGVVGSQIMIQPTLLQYSFDGPPVPVLLDVRSISPDVILLFDSYFHVVIHYGSKIAQWRRLGYDRDPSHENLRKLLEAPEVDAEQLVAERVPAPKLIKCDQHSSQARFLLAKLNPSVNHNSTYTEGSDVIFTDDLSLQVFIDHLQTLAVQG
ncbi:Gelsolin domain-containing protein/zf-Sec23_Sec24 domain-containing protein/Sec23_trunk domain-containing protein/Sec23_helical domain-containing protein/Sec23_BS domain-containing protein [Cephalotus follicularis]|uniref:Protein transport protein SEC23 n=1 Tax=Cephalotus follicularis TaxID=3775 RepID=A0A1Q3BNK4_CEPFO|nr:Gelsolin domain-containing protein/zf-Sec23_Sec24 domain-containing protein/Sec23_trunk domain-containing protein/Sec23_helical domain-containing protein/Sec23_BS domain-containing protein [Cephalotus follicularis]